MNFASKKTPLPQFWKVDENRVGSDIFHCNAARSSEPLGESGPIKPVAGPFLWLVTELTNPLQAIGNILFASGPRIDRSLLPTRPCTVRRASQHSGGGSNCLRLLWPFQDERNEQVCLRRLLSAHEARTPPLLGLGTGWFQKRASSNLAGLKAIS